MNHAFAIIPLTIEARGEIITSNFPAFADMVRGHLAGFNRTLGTDDEFDQAEKDAGVIKGAEEALKKAKEKALQDAESLHALFDQIDGLSAELAAARLDLTNQIKKRKEEVKSEIIEEYLAAFDIDPRAARKHFLSGLQSQIKGKRTLDSMRTACRVYQTTQQAMIIKSRESIERFVAKFGPDLVMDRRELELKSTESVEAELVRRYEAKKAADDLAKSQAEAAAAKAEADKAKAALAEASKPPAVPEKSPPPIVEKGGGGSERMPAMAALKTAPEPTAEKAADHEWATFKAGVTAAFAPIKAARAGLKHSANIAKAQVFANAVATAWKEAM